MKNLFATLLTVALSCAAVAQVGPVPKGVPHLDHVFVIMMENHGYSQILNNPNAPFINSYASAANLATNYYGVAHPSLTNYLEAVGASNFGVLSDNNSDWHNSSCSTNLSIGIANTDNPASGPICPIAGVGTDAAIPLLDTINETQGLPGETNIDGIHAYAASSYTVGITLADQFVDAKRTWKSYQESLPASGPDRINYSDGFFTNLTDFSKINPQLTPPLSQAEVASLYASKHNPFVYFASVQVGTNPALSYAQIADFNQLFADLSSGRVPHYSFIAPNQCNDQHGRGNAGAFCNYDPTDDGTQAGLNPALIYRGDVSVQRLVTAIHNSPAWRRGNNAIIVTWDENDYSLAPNTNRVVTIVDTNYGAHHLQSAQFYTHFSLVKSIEAGFGLPCLNHACDASVNVMSDLFGGNEPESGK